MTRTKKKRWSYITGAKGVNRVRAYEHAVTGTLYAEYYDDGKRVTVPLGHQDRAQAQAQAEQLAADLRAHDQKAVGPVTFGALIDNYLREVSPTKSESKRRHDTRAAMFALTVLGRATLVRSLTQRDAARFIAERRRRGDQRAGRAAPRALGPRSIQYDLSFLQAVFNWGARSGLIERNPWALFRPDLEKYTPRRAVLTRAQYEAILSVAAEVAPQFRLALVLAYETGHRIGAICRLWWSDVSVEDGMIRWRAVNDKIGYAHVTPLSQRAREALRDEQQRTGAIGDRFVLPSPVHAETHVSTDLVGTWWRRAQRLAGLAPEPGRGWHSLRRAFATELKATPLKDLCALGGWKDPQTILRCYQSADPVTMKLALEGRMRLEG